MDLLKQYFYLYNKLINLKWLVEVRLFLFYSKIIHLKHRIKNDLTAKKKSINHGDNYAWLTKHKIRREKNVK